MIDQRIIDTYQELGSIKDTAKQLGVSDVKVRRTLITVGLWRSRSSDAVNELLSQELSVDEVAEQLHISRKAVEAYMPYSRGSYDAHEQSLDSVKSHNYRARKQHALSRQVNHTSQSKVTKERESKMILSDNVSRKTIHLHMELDTQYLDAEERKILKDYGKTSETISRDVLVPNSITLHALHYVIQRAFGWQNSHLHHYELPEDIFEMLTGGRFKDWGELCGIYFRMPTDDYEDLYWDDDYDGDVSFRTWLRKKYCGPYRYEGSRELYLDCQRELRNLYKQLPTVPIRVSFEEFRKNPNGRMIEKTISPQDATIEEMTRSVDFGGSLESLLERLMLSDVMLLNGEDIPAKSDRKHIEAMPLTKELRYFYDYGDGWVVNISLVEQSEEAIQHPEVAEEEKPICVACDGLNALDDVGGVSGFCQFLHDLKHLPADERSGLRDWSRMLGWTGRMQKPDNIL